MLEIIIAIIGSSVLTAIVTELFRRNRTRSETRKSYAEADSLAVEAASDALEMSRGTYQERIAYLEKKAGEFERDCRALTLQQGEIRRAAELLNAKIAELESEVELWRSRVGELIRLLERNHIPPPAWAQAAPVK